MTWQEIYAKAQTIAGDDSAATLTQLKQDINTGNKRFNAAINNYFNRRSKSANLVADQQYYQLPADCIRVMGVDFLQSATRRLPITQIRSEYEWRRINSTQQSGNYLSYWFQKGADELGLFPIPSEATTNGLIIYYEPKGFNFSQDDYTTGTVELTQGSATVAGTGTTFASTMVGREFKVTDGSDGYEYKVASFTSTTVITLEEPYVGISGPSKTYKIGETPLFPSEFHDSLVDYGLSRFYELNNNPERAKYHMTNFNDAVAMAKELYSSSSASQVINLDQDFAYNPFFDNTNPVVEA